MQAVGEQKVRCPDVGIFLDAENLSNYLKDDGSSKLVEIALEFGNPMLMRAYSNWSNSALNTSQRK
jgi:hypothetical protein